MIRRLAFIGARLAVLVMCLITWTYGVVVSVPFAFEQFIRPQLFPWLTQFVIWYHAWYWAAFLLSAATIVPDLYEARRNRMRRGTGWLVLAYLVCFGGVGVYLIGTPYLASLDGGTRTVFIVPGALLPLVWLALIDHVAPLSPYIDRPQVTGQRRLLAASIATAVSIWFAHSVLTLVGSDTPHGAVEWAVTAGWALALDVMAMLAVFVVLNIGLSFAAMRPHTFQWEYSFAVAVTAVVITEYFRRIVLPSFSFGGVEAAQIAMPLGAALALVWSGWRVRLQRNDPYFDTGLTSFWGICDGHSPKSILLVCLVPVAAVVSMSLVQHIDWALIVNRLIGLLEAALIFRFFLNRFRTRQDGAWSLRALVIPPLAAMVILIAAPYATGALAATRGAAIDSQRTLDRMPAIDALASLAASQFVEQPKPDATYYRAMTAFASSQSALRPAVPATTIAGAVAPIAGTPPNVFIFAIDSLRRDYLSPYNPAVTFTPAIASLASDGYVFTNAFTAHGGTWLSVPSMWTGVSQMPGWGGIFNRLNVVEPLINSAGYDFLINDYTVEQQFMPATPRTFLNPGVASVNTDLCRNLEALRAHLDQRSTPRRPVFTFLQPMNIHILNTRTGDDGSGRKYPGFYSPYASRLERMDTCVGAFVQDLQRRGEYDNSIIILTADHGDSLGEDGSWGHQFFLFPEDIRVPLIVHLPRWLRDTHTTDLARVAQLTDLAPTLLALLGQPVRDLGPPFGAPLFVAPDSEPRPRRREPLLIKSSYGSTYAVLRRNGKFLYISDLVNWREYAYTLSREPVGERVPVTDVIRRVGQADIRRRVDEVASLYRTK